MSVPFRLEYPTWYVAEFAMGDFKCTGRTVLILDHASQDFGFVYWESGGGEAASVRTLPSTGQPVIFSAKDAMAICYHDESPKISILYRQTQADMLFYDDEDAYQFYNAFVAAAKDSQNLNLYCYEVHDVDKFEEEGFDMTKEQLVVERLLRTREISPFWPSLRRSGEWSDFTIVAGGKSFSVHSNKLHKESEYFRAIFNGGFAENDSRVINLPESERTINALLDQIYEMPKSTTESLFTGFVLLPAEEQEQPLNDLLELLIAADKYSLEKIKARVAKAITDRMPFIKDALTVVDLAIAIFDEQMPQVDCLRKQITEQIRYRMPMIVTNAVIWKEYSESKELLKAVHMHLFAYAKF
ncbi:hypothetical protein E8E13_006718 [Curvularia kusanoi]|uniref:BTB domain-containing protein n=1 Tax=Curvularia kusanoi TaxID=90978 RepID=A0A9P4TPL8_CURKU|nr:hypothetical protein E8E13_006718 [Curvularia kusanoi]